MDQEAWNQIYADLERDIDRVKQRGVSLNELDVILEIDRARFAMERGDSDEGIARIQSVKRLLRDADPGPTRSAPGAAPALDRLDALEDSLHGTMRLGSARLEIVGEDDEEIAPTRSASRNTKVNKAIKFDDIKDEYLALWNACQIRSDKASAVKREADRLLANRKVYEEISDETSVPWWFIGLLHQMECSYSVSKHLHNGDSLKARTWQVPAGRPKEGSPPFTFVQSAIDALEVDGFAGKTDWPLAMVLWRMERYNGFGYRRKFGFATPYLWSYTNHFTAGKYVKDGVFDPNAPSKQCGTAATLRDLMQRGLVSFEEKRPEPVVAAAPPKPTPAASSEPGPTPTPVVPAAVVAAQAPVVVAQPAPAEVPAAGPGPGPAPVTVKPAEVAPAPKPVEPNPAPAPVVAPPAAPVAAPAAAAAAALAAALPAAASPAESSPVGAPVSAPAPAAPEAQPPSPAASSSAEAKPVPVVSSPVSPAVAAALAELARRRD